MERLPREVSEYLHSASVRPFTQYVEVKNNIAFWKINVLTDKICVYFNELVTKLDGEEVLLKQRNKKYKLILYSESTIYDYKELSYYFFVDIKPVRRLHLSFITPTSFKVYGQYQIFPDIRLILASIYKRWNKLSDSVVFEDEQAFKQLCDSIYIRNYHLHSWRFYLEKISVTGFGGNIEISIKGPEMTVRWANLLLAYGMFCGVGIKTALGMGAVSTYEIIYSGTKCDKLLLDIKNIKETIL